MSRAQADAAGGRGMSANNGGPAFPQHVLTPLGSGAGSWSTVGGMTLRDYFAAKAMQAMLTARGSPWDQKMPGYAYTIADAMLAERAK